MVTYTDMKFVLQIYHPVMYVQWGISVSQTSLVERVIVLEFCSCIFLCDKLVEATASIMFAGIIHILVHQSPVLEGVMANGITLFFLNMQNTLSLEVLLESWRWSLMKLGTKKDHTVFNILQGEYYHPILKE
jgi:hypothetical protein